MSCLNSSSPSRPFAEGGQVVPLLALSLLFAALVGVGLVRTATAIADRGAAQAAADAAALAGAEDGRTGAQSAARANGAELVYFIQDHLDVEVKVVRRGHTASARARWLPRDTNP